MKIVNEIKQITSGDHYEDIDKAPVNQAGSDYANPSPGDDTDANNRSLTPEALFFDSLINPNNPLMTVAALRTKPHEEQLALLAYYDNERESLLHRSTNYPLMIAISELMSNWPVSLIDRALKMPHQKPNRNSLHSTWNLMLNPSIITSDELRRTNFTCFVNITRHLSWSQILDIFPLRENLANELSARVNHNKLVKELTPYLLFKKLIEYSTTILLGLCSAKQGWELPEDLVLMIAIQATLNSLSTQERLSFPAENLQVVTQKIVTKRYEKIRGIFARREQDTLPDAVDPQHVAANSRR